MNKQERDTIEQLIHEEVKKTKALITDYKELTKPIAPENAIGRISRMDAINNKSVNEAALRQAENKLAGLIRALENISEPDFGLCAKCRNSIPTGRILLMPHSRFCVSCAQ